MPCVLLSYKSSNNFTLHLLVKFNSKNLLFVSIFLLFLLSRFSMFLGLKTSSLRGGRRKPFRQPGEATAASSFSLGWNQTWLTVVAGPLRCPGNTLAEKVKVVLFKLQIKANQKNGYRTKIPIFWHKYRFQTKFKTMTNKINYRKLPSPFFDIKKRFLYLTKLTLAIYSQGLKYNLLCSSFL